MSKRYKSKSNTIMDTVIYIIMGLVLLICIIPFLYMLTLSISDPKAIVNNQVKLWPVGFNLEAYKQIFTYPNFFKAYGNTIFYTVVGTAIALAMTTLFAYPLSKSFLKGHGLLMKMVIFSMYFSGGLIPNYLLISSLHLTGTIWAMLLPFAINQFNLIILINFFKSLPQELEEAALIDGLGYFGILKKIVIPLSKPALATIGLYTAVFFWNDWFNGLIYLNTSQFPVMLFLRNIVNGTAVMGEGAGSADKATIAISIKSAVIITSTLPIIVLYPFLQKYFVKGLTVGAVKG
ncbi:carbohydrate ABC transporter permease [Niameybacter massiliensis]|uniref:Carbohydrate ABC transporter permease n=1 Tax=Holtiella tumoricola TaxID=3018743 RepID=A0AA42DME4_9FIRM|nr:MULTISPECIES: carbohydrate ABC transporter permease [Lachnospirales]MDA3731323.1 carbohydrate ABC transporter permease [Holtiella tumoricola]